MEVYFLEGRVATRRLHEQLEGHVCRMVQGYRPLLPRLDDRQREARTRVGEVLQEESHPMVVGEAQRSQGDVLDDIGVLLCAM